MGLYEDARKQAFEVLEVVASNQSTIAYSELVRKVSALPLEPDSKILARILDEISAEQDHAGRGMLSAVVVHKTGDYLPGPGFFALARALGKPVGDRVAFHATEVALVHAAFSHRPRQ